MNEITFFVRHIICQLQAKLIPQKIIILLAQKWLYTIKNNHLSVILIERKQSTISSQKHLNLIAVVNFGVPFYCLQTPILLCELETVKNLLALWSDVIYMFHAIIQNFFSSLGIRRGRIVCSE